MNPLRARNDEIYRRWKEGENYIDLANEYGRYAQGIRSLIERREWQELHKDRVPGPSSMDMHFANRERDAEIIGHRTAGMTWTKLGEKFKLSPERCRQIYCKHEREKLKKRSRAESRVMSRSFFEGTPVDELELSVRAVNYLKNENICTIEELKRRSDAEIIRTPNVGRKTLKELKEAIAAWEKQEKPGAWVPTVLPSPYEPKLAEVTVQLLGSINQHLAMISGLLMRGQSDQFLMQISVMVQYLFEQQTGLNPATFFEQRTKQGARQ